MNAAMNLIAIEDIEINKQAVGRIVFWQLLGQVEQAALASALGSAAKPPDEVSPAVALHRAVEHVARSTGGEVHQVSRGVWAVVGKGQQEAAEESALGSIAYAIRSKARLSSNSAPAVEGGHADEIAEAFSVAKASLSPQDMSAWLCKQLDRLGAVALRETGGFYFVPQDVVGAWDAIAAAVKFTSQHKLYAVPALKSADALDAILGAVTLDTRAACKEAARDLGTLGQRALQAREAELKVLIERAGRYEKILGRKLDSLRGAIEQTRNAVATAMFALASEPDAE